VDSGFKNVLIRGKKHLQQGSGKINLFKQVFSPPPDFLRE